MVLDYCLEHMSVVFCNVKLLETWRAYWLKVIELFTNLSKARITLLGMQNEREQGLRGNS